MQIDLSNLFVYLVFGLAISIFIHLAILFALHFLMPKQLLKEYFRKPYFREGEIIIFTGFPFAYIRTSMFMRVIAFPNSGKARGMTEAFKLAPKWLRVISKIWIITVLVTFIPVLIIGIYGLVFL
jgi:hypothetical protein